ADIRQKEVDFYTNNFWVWGSTSSVIMAGFMFDMLTQEIPEGTNEVLSMVYLAFTSLCLSLDMCVITWTILLCMWGPELALRGTDGMKAFNDSVAFLKSEQSRVYAAFVASVVAYFGSSCTLLWVYPSRNSVNTMGTFLLLFALLMIMYIQCKLDVEIGGWGNIHEEVDGQIKAFSAFDNIADLDTY
ncbi:unnamed protein product, partial [Polarella glacialis]